MPKEDSIIGADNVVAISDHWEFYGHVMDRIVADELLDYALTKKYTPEVLEAYRDGLIRIAERYKACHTELENKNKEDHGGED